MKQIFENEVVEILKSYVYLYIDPRNNEIFYIGKGRGNRAFDHLTEDSDKDKVARIRDIKSEGLEPIIELLRYGLTDNDAEMIEASAIDLLAHGCLTNGCRGKGCTESGRIPAAAIIAIHSARPATIQHKVLLIKINKTFKYNMPEDELYHATRGVWRAGTDRQHAQYAFAVFRGVVQEVYKIETWHKAGTTLKPFRPDAGDPKYSKRWEFSGHKANESIRDMYVGKSVRHYMTERESCSIRYVNIKVA